MNRTTEKIVGILKDRILEKYMIKEMRVFGSSARGDYRPESDIDVLVHLVNCNRKIEEDIFDIAYDLELQYDCLIDVIVVDDDALTGIQGKAPIYENIRSEGAVV